MGNSFLKLKAILETFLAYLTEIKLTWWFEEIPEEHFSDFELFYIYSRQKKRRS